MNTNVFYLCQGLGGWSRHLVLPLKSTNNSLSPLQICLGTLVLRHGCLTDICILLTNGKHCLNILSSVPKRKIKTAPTFSWISLPAENMPVLHVYVSILVVGFLTTSGGKKSDHLAGSSASGQKSDHLVRNLTTWSCQKKISKVKLGGLGPAT